MSDKADESGRRAGCTGTIDLLTPLEPFQEIKLTGYDEDYIHVLKSKEVKVTTTNKSYYNSGSSRVKINNIVDFPWEVKYHHGHLVTSYKNFIAYSLLVKTGNGVVRVIDHKKNSRLLIKGFKGQVKDVAFAISYEAILACIDEYGNLQVHKIEYRGASGNLELISEHLFTLQRDDPEPSDYHMLFWCPYIPESDSEVDDNFWLLAVTHDDEVEVLNVEHLAEKYAHSKTIQSNSFPANCRQIIQQKKPITVATFSPDGTAIATGNMAGEVKFFEVSSEAKGQTPNCLHHWVPHGGKPISALFFLDNCKSHQPDVQFWKFALTGADCNQELKVWSCESWECLQTIKFFSKDNESRSIILKAELDASASYLLLSDILNKSVYVLQIYQNFDSATAHICSIGEFSVANTVLSITIVDALKCMIKITDEIEPVEKNGNDQNGNEEDDEESRQLSVKGISIKCFWINSKSFQESRITYVPPVMLPQQNDEVASLLSHDSVVYRDRLSDLSCDVLEHDQSNNSFLEHDVSLLRESDLSSLRRESPMSAGGSFNRKLSDRQEIRLSPEAYTSPSHPKQSKSSSSLLNHSTPTTTHSVPMSPESPTEELPPAQVKLMPFKDSLNNPLADEGPLATSEGITIARRKSSQRSSGSSPSQEVADIMAPAKELDLVAKTDSLIEINTRLSSDDNQMNGIACKESPLRVESHNTLVSPLIQQDFASWPQAPDLSKEYRLVGQKIEKTFVQKPIFGSAGDSMSDAELKSTLLRLQSSLDLLNSNVASVANTSLEHSSDIQNLHLHLKKNLEMQRHFQSLGHRLDNLETNFYSQMQKTVANQSVVDYNKLENLIARRQDMDRQWLEKQVVDSTLSTSAAMTNKLEKSIKQEMKNVVIPSVTKSMDVWKDQLQQDFVQRMSISESGIRESMKQLLKNKNFIDAVSQNVTICIQPQIQGICKDLFQQHLVPVVDKVCQNLFVQLNESFKMGTSEYLKQVEVYIEQSTHKMQANLTSSVEAKLHDQVSQQAKNNEAFVHNVKMQVHKKFEESWAQLSNNLASQMRSTIVEEVRSAITELTPNLTAHFAEAISSSRAMTPVPQSFDPAVQQQQILTFLKNNNLNAAFQQALNAVDANLVMFVCESISVSEVFDQQPCPLKPTVLLPLINQLGNNLGKNTETKLAYLEASVLNLEANDPCFQGHLVQVLTSLKEKLTNYLRQNPSSPYISKIKLLLMATNSLISS